MAYSIENATMPVSAATEEEIRQRLTQYVYWSKQDRLSEYIVRQMMNDPVVKSGFSLLWKPIMSIDYEINSQVQEQADYLKSKIKAVWNEIVMCAVYSMLQNGYAAGEIIYAIDDDGYYIRDIADGKPSAITLYEADETGEIYPMIDGVIIPVWKSIIARWEYTTQNPYGISVLKSAYQPWHYKQMAELSRARSLERLSGVQLFIEYPPDVTTVDGAIVDNNEVVFQSVAKNFNRNRLAGGQAQLPEKPQWKITPIPQAAASMPYKDAISDYNSDILRAFGIPDRMFANSDGSGSYADQTGKQDIYYLMLSGLIEYFGQIVESRILKPLGQLQYGGLYEPATIDFAPLADSEKLLYSELIKIGYDKGLINIDGEYMKGKLGVDDKPDVLPIQEAINAIPE